MSEPGSRIVQAKVKVESLKKGMVIKAYSGFSSRYNMMDALTCEFVRHNFRGTRVIVLRGDKKFNIEVEDLKPGDTLKGIHHFPPALQKLTIVTPELIGALKKRGMLAFIAVQPMLIAEQTRKELRELLQMVEETTRSQSTPAIGRNPKLRSISARIVSDLVESVQKSLPIRQETVESIQYEMDNARRGILSVKSIENSVNNITVNESIAALLAISSLKESQQTYDHCVDVGVIFQSVYLKIQTKRRKKSVFSKKNQAMLGGFLHDFGKSVVPHEILDSKKKFDKNSRPMQILRSHPIHGARQLTVLNLPKAIVEMAGYHHVKMDGDMLSSYPQDVSFKNISFEVRLLSIIDIYQALVGTRSYQRSWSPPATMRYLEALAGVEIDQYAFDLFIREMGVYPKGSLVELSDGSLGFVMNVPQGDKDINRPIIAIVRNNKGEDITHHHLLDLAVEKDISIAQDIDRKDAFGEKTVDIFTSITVS
ncbi:HD domain-containing protein [bacterium]|nr:HD domain-containing protein [bacterium]